MGDGCGASPIKQVVVTIPAGVETAKPMPKAGWTLKVTGAKQAAPREDHDKAATKEVTRISWTAKTPADYLQSNWYDEFVLQAKLPAKGGTIYWPVGHTCEESRVDWIDVPKAGQKLGDLESPAALLELMRAAGNAHQH